MVIRFFTTYQQLKVQERLKKNKEEKAICGFPAACRGELNLSAKILKIPPLEFHERKISLNDHWELFKLNIFYSSTMVSTRKFTQRLKKVWIIINA